MTAPVPPFESAFQALIHVLEQLAFPYCVLGALAVGVWGVPRTTQDLDVLVALDEPNRERLIQRLTEHQFIFDTQWANSNPMVRAWHLRFRQGPIPLDVLLPRDAHDQAVLTRRKRQNFEHLAFWVISAEDLILHKLKVGRPRDFEDAVAVITRQSSSLELLYLQEWAQRLGITEELAYCLRQSGFSA